MKARIYFIILGALVLLLLVSCQKKEQVIPVSSVSINQTMVELVIGETIQLSATVSPSDATDKSISWSSSNQAIATVANGKVTAVAEGAANITASCGGQSATCSVTITIPVESIDLWPSSLELYEGRSETLYATVTPSNATENQITWSSSSTSIATVDENGKVTAIKDGEAIITAMAGGKTATSKVFVKKDVIIVFADSNLKEKLVAAFDTNGDGELSYGEAEAVNSGDALKTAFGTNKSYKSFDEFQYFTSFKYLPNSLFSGWILSSIVLPNTARSVGMFVFDNCSLLSSVVLPEGLEEIQGSAFRGCTSLTSITIPENVTNFGAGVFEGCASLSSFVIPNKVKYIENFMFKGCASLSSITIPEGVEYIGNESFASCLALTSVILPESVTTIGEGAFRYCNGLTSINIPKGVATIPSCTFEDCYGLTTISIPETVTDIGASAFRNCNGLTSINIPASVARIKKHSFNGCSSLTSISIPESVGVIEDSAFRDCRGLSSITIPANVGIIGERAFEYCYGLTSITVLSTTVPSGGRYMFNTGHPGSSCPIYVPAASVEAYKTAEYWNEYADRIQAIPE